MNKSFILTVCVAVLVTAAFAADPPPYLTANPVPGTNLGGGGQKGSDTVLVNNLVTSGGEIRNGLSGCEYAAHNSWVAFDYTPSSAVVVKQVTLDYLYNSTRLKNTVKFQVYRGTNPGVGSVVSSFSIPASGYTETATGWIAFSRPVYRATIPIPDQSLSASTKYWFAYRSANNTAATIVYWAVQATLKEEQVWWYLSGSWGSGSSKGAGGTYDQSYSIEDTQTGVEPVSLGKVKTLFK